MKKKELEDSKEKILKKIDDSDNFAILVSDPDTDAVGTGLAMEEILESLGKSSKLYSSFDLKDFSYLPRFEKFIIKDISKLDFSKFECLIVLDSAEPRRLVDETKGQKLNSIPKVSFIINIDHHASNILFGDINYVPTDPIISSTAEAVFDIFEKELKITKSLATNLLFAIIGDTASFKYTTSINPQLFRIVANLLEKGADHRMIVQETFYSYDPKIMKMNFEILNNFKTKKVGKYTYAYTFLDMDKYHLTDVHRYQVHIVKEMLRSIKGTDFAVMIRFTKNKKTKLSFRSRNVEVVKLAEALGGGGHREAAAAPMNATKEEAIEKLNSLLKKIELPVVKTH